MAGVLDFKGAVSHFVNVSEEVIYAIAKNSIAKSYWVRQKTFQKKDMKFLLI